jgi:hypothetical protein
MPFNLVFSPKIVGIQEKEDVSLRLLSSPVSSDSSIAFGEFKDNCPVVASDFTRTIGAGIIAYDDFIGLT